VAVAVQLLALRLPQAVIITDNLPWDFYAILTLLHAISVPSLGMLNKLFLAFWTRGSGSRLVSMRIWIQLFISMRIQIGVQATKPLPIYADPDVDPGHKEVEVLHEKGTKAFLKGSKPGLFVNFGQFLCSWIRVRILIPIRIWILLGLPDP
jgi:hypothetical protein